MSDKLQKIETEGEKLLWEIGQRQKKNRRIRAIGRMGPH